MGDEHWVECGVRFDDGYVVKCADEAEARVMVERHGGKVLTRQVYETSWLPAGQYGFGR